MKKKLKAKVATKTVSKKASPKSKKRKIIIDDPEPRKPSKKQQDIPLLLDRLAEENGINRGAVVKFPQLFKGTGIKPEHVTLAHIDKAEAIHRAKMKEIIERHGANKPRISQEWVDWPPVPPREGQQTLLFDAKPKRTKPEGASSNKEVVYKAWLKSKDKSVGKAAEYSKLVKDAVKMNTIKSWISEWNRGRNLPACAKK